MIAMILITGFLGSGKTTWRRTCVRSPSGFALLRQSLAASGCIDDALRHRLLRPPCQKLPRDGLGPDE